MADKAGKWFPCVYCRRMTAKYVVVGSACNGLGTATAKAGDQLAVCSLHQEQAKMDMQEAINERIDLDNEQRSTLYF